MMKRIPSLCLFFTLMLMIGACAPRFERPLMSPMDTERGYWENYGYAEEEIAPGRWKITYLSRDEGTFPFRDRRDRLAARLSQEAFDFALWRAGELALENGFDAFRLEKEERDLREHIVGREPDMFPGGDPYDLRFIPISPYFYSAVWIQVTMTLTIEMLEGGIVGVPGQLGDVYDAKDVIERSGAKYPTAFEPVPPPPVP